MLRENIYIYFYKCECKYSSKKSVRLRVYDSAGAKNKDNLSTLTMVFILVGVVKGVFICFAVVAVCYRY